MGRGENETTAAGIVADLDYYRDHLRRLTRYRGPGGRAPHKPCLLLAVLDLIERGAVRDGKIGYMQILEESLFPAYFSLATGIEQGSPGWRQKYRPFDPFWHMKNEQSNFWKLHPRLGREREFAEMPRSGGKTHKQVLLNVAYAELDSSFFALLRNRGDRNAIRQAILDEYFSDTDFVAKRHKARVKQRDPRFPEAVIQAYEGRCAATGEKITIPDAAGSRIALVEAAHLIPYCLSFNNDPRNGMALQPTYHKAMDQFLIAPGTDGKWHVSRTLLEASGETRESQLCSLDGERVCLPGNKALRPKKDGLEWRMDNLLD